MKQIAFILSAILLMSGGLAAQTKEDIIKRVWEGAGGKKKWEDTRYLTFVFNSQTKGKAPVRRNHLWDKKSGKYRFETRNSDNENLVVLFNVKNQKGKSFINGKLLSDSLNDIEIKKAYHYFQTDSYWLIAPLQFEDRNVVVKLEDPEDIEGSSYQVLHVYRQKDKGNKGAQYWFYIDLSTGRIIRSKVLFAEGRNEPEIYNWINYKDLGGGLILSTHKQNINQNNSITFPVASVLISVEPEKFTKE